MKHNRPNLVIVICHDLGQQLGCYRVADQRSPNIDRLAASGIRFANSFCTAPQCSPSRAALWTGRYPHANGVVGLTHWDFANDLHPDELHLAQRLNAAGYETHLFGNQHEAHQAERCGHAQIHGGGPCAQVASQVEDWVQGRGPVDKPFFVEICFFEPHRPFPHEDVPALDPDALTVPPYLPDIPEVRQDLADLEASIASADLAVGRILAALDGAGLAEDTVVLFTADHGIAFPHAKMTLYDPGIAVPLILRLPGLAGGRVLEPMVSNVDVVPTLLEMLGLGAPEEVQGRSFWGLLAGQPCVEREAIYAEKTYHTYYDPMRAIRTARWKLIANFEFAPWQETSPDYDNNAKSYVEVSRAVQVPYGQQYHPPYELFDLEADPWEQVNLADDPAYAEVRDDLARRLRKWMRDTGDPLLDGPMAQGTYVSRMRAFKEL